MALKNEDLSSKVIELIKELEQSGYRSARAASSLVEIGKPAIQPLVEILENEDAWIIERASKSFPGDQLTRENLNLTSQLELEYIYWRISKVIIEILGKIGNSGKSLATRPLIEIATSLPHGEEFRCLAIESLGKITDPPAIEVLIKLLISPEENMTVKLEFVTALGRFNDQIAVEGLIKAAVASTNSRFRDRIMKTTASAFPSAYFLPVCSCLLESGTYLEEGMIQKLLEMLVIPLEREFSTLLGEVELQACLVKLKPYFLSILLAGSSELKNQAKILLKLITGLEEKPNS